MHAARHSSDDSGLALLDDGMSQRFMGQRRAPSRKAEGGGSAMATSFVSIARSCSSATLRTPAGGDVGSFPTRACAGRSIQLRRRALAARALQSDLISKPAHGHNVTVRYSRSDPPTMCLGLRVGAANRRDLDPPRLSRWHQVTGPARSQCSLGQTSATASTIRPLEVSLDRPPRFAAQPAASRRLSVPRAKSETP